MCAIAGIVNFNAAEPVDPWTLVSMTRAQAHRGPDDEGIFIDRNAGLGHRRLSIIDLSGGRQPIFNEDRSVVVVFNGEIYNYAELTNRLIAKGHRFQTRSDTETIVHAYEEFGDDCVRDFRGMFAFALWDRRRRRLLVARDRLGIKPVYYFSGKDVLVFASEIKALLAHPAVTREIDAVAVDLYLALRYVPGPRTMFRNIFKLQPGHVMTADQRGVRVTEYWDIRYEQAPDTSENEWLERFGHVLEESVRLRLISEVPLGVFLSGGLDSSAMVAVTSRITGRERVKTFSVGYEASGPSAASAAASNEFAYAREAARHCGADHHEFLVTAGDFAEAIPRMVAHLDEPLADPSCLPLYFIARRAREEITVVLSGEGADEILGGYALYPRLMRLESARRALGPFARAAGICSRLPVGPRAGAYLRRASLPLERHYRGVVKGISSRTRLALTGQDRFSAAEELLDDVFGDYFRLARQASPLNQMLYVDAKVWLPENLLLKADKMTMAAAVELRVPFLDHKLVEMAATMPDSMKVRNGTGKWILRQSMSPELPEGVLRRRKQGFPSPTESWLRFELREFVNDTVLGPASSCREYFDGREVESAVRRGSQGNAGGYQEIWSLVVFEHWRRYFFKDFAAPPVPRTPVTELAG